MTFLKYGTDPILDKLVDSPEYRNRLSMAERGYGLDKLINDESYLVRKAVANQGYGLNVLINDSDGDVRYECIISDKWPVFCAGSWKTLINNNYWYIRNAVAACGYGLDVFVNDEVPDVRYTVAKQGYGLNKLINDEDYWVRRACCECDAWPEFCANNWETLITSKHDHVRRAVVERGYGLNTLLTDKSYEVRTAIAKYGYGLDTLINDDDYTVSTTCLKHTNWWTNFCATNWENLVMHKNYWIRVAVAKQRYGLNILINDDRWLVRKAVAEQGYGLNILIDDNDPEVRRATLEFLVNNGYTSIDEYNKQNSIDVHNAHTLVDSVQNFIYAINESSKNFKLVIDGDLSDFHNITCINIICIDINCPILTLDKVKDENGNDSYIFLVDIELENIEFRFKKNILTENDFKVALESSVQALYNYKELSKYADELDTCIKH